LNLKKWLLTRWGINRLPDVHIVDRYLATASTLGVSNDQNGLDYHLPPDGFAGAVQTMAATPYLAFVIGAAHPTKCLTEVQKIAFCQAYSGRIVLLGGPQEQTEGERIATAAGEHVHNACGSFNLHESAYLVQQASAVLSHDTGLMHIAAAFQKPIVSIWGNTVTDFGMYPYLPAGGIDLRVEVEGLSCRPCSKIGYPACPKGHFNCIHQIATADILAKVETVLA
ncbi:MAG: glycosyltransferase family 9 protein, partial [Bacteroidota bacterium]